MTTRVTRINTFIAREGQGDALRDHLASFLPAIRGSAGCEGCQLLRSADASERIVVIEVWESREAHRASVANIPPGAVERAMTLLAGPPSGEYYTNAE